MKLIVLILTSICLPQEEKLEREAKKAEALEMKKFEKEKKKWEKGKLALKSIVAEIDPKVIQDGKLGGWLHLEKKRLISLFHIKLDPVFHCEDIMIKQKFLILDHTQLSDNNSTTTKSFGPLCVLIGS